MVCVVSPLPIKTGVSEDVIEVVNVPSRKAQIETKAATGSCDREKG